MREGRLMRGQLTDLPAPDTIPACARTLKKTHTHLRRALLFHLLWPLRHCRDVAQQEWRASGGACPDLAQPLLSWARSEREEPRPAQLVSEQGIPANLYPDPGLPLTGPLTSMTKEVVEQFKAEPAAPRRLGVDGGR